MSIYVGAFASELGDQKPISELKELTANEELLSTFTSFGLHAGGAGGETGHPSYQEKLEE